MYTLYRQPFDFVIKHFHDIVIKVEGAECATALWQSCVALTPLRGGLGPTSNGHEVDRRAPM